MKVNLENIYEYRWLAMLLAAKEVKIKYKSALLGWAWSFLNPLVLMVIFSFVFTFIMKVGVEKFPVFLLTALLPWFFTSFSLSQAVVLIVDNASLLKKAYFPYEVIPFSAMIANLVNFVISLFVLFVFLLYFHCYPTVYWCFLPLVVVTQSIFVLGICLAAAAMHTMFRDVKYIIEMILLVWFYASPIFYPLSFVPEKIRFVFYLNPMSLFIVLYRDILLYGNKPDMRIFLITIIVSLFCCIIGNLIFSHYKKFFVDVT